MDFRDKRGRYLFQDIKDGVKAIDRVWVLYIWSKGDTGRLTRHLAYIRKVKVKGEVFYVYSDFMPATPVWMKQ
jgi:hypothetical protein